MSKQAVPTPFDPAKFYTMRAVAEILGIHKMTIARAIKAGALRAHHFGADGRIVRIAGADAIAFTERDARKAA